MERSVYILPPAPPPIWSPGKRAFGSRPASVAESKFPGRRFGDRGWAARGSTPRLRRAHRRRHQFWSKTRMRPRPFSPLFTRVPASQSPRARRRVSALFAVPEEAEPMTGGVKTRASKPRQSLIEPSDRSGPFTVDPQACPPDPHARIVWDRWSHRTGGTSPFCAPELSPCPRPQKYLRRFDPIIQRFPR